MSDTPAPQKQCPQCLRWFDADYEFVPGLGTLTSVGVYCSKACRNGALTTAPVVVIPARPPPLSYIEARTQARAMLGSSADVAFDAKQIAFPARVTVRVSGSPSKTVIVGAGNDYREALADAKKRQDFPITPKASTDDDE